MKIQTWPVAWLVACGLYVIFLLQQEYKCEVDMMCQKCCTAN